MDAARAVLAARRRYASPVSTRDVLIDLLMLTAAAAAALLTDEHAGLSESHPVALLAFVIAVPLILVRAGVYRVRAVPLALDDARTIVAATAVAATAVTFVAVLFDPSSEVPQQIARQWAFAVVYMLAARVGVRIAEARARRLGEGRPTLIIGGGNVAHLVARRLEARPELGLRPVGFIDDEPLDVANPAGVPVLGGVADLERAALEHRVQHAILAFARWSHEVEIDILGRLQVLGIPVSVIPRVFEAVPDRVVFERVVGLPMIDVFPIDPRGWRFSMKYLVERLLAALITLLLLPVLAICALAVLLSAGWPILFRQRRVGRDGIEFDMLKFRTMRGDPKEAGEADAAWAQAVLAQHGARAPEALPPKAAAAPAEDRTTRVGAILRRTGLDELPQLVNVVRGEMSLAGPRPERQTYVELFEGSVPKYGKRHRVKAGITGWAQVHGLRGETSLDDRVDWDNYYIENWTPWLELKVMLLTLTSLFRRPDRP